MVKRFVLLTTGALIATGPLAHAGNSCAELLSGIAKRADGVSKPRLKVDGTDGLIAYMVSLLEHQIIGDLELLRLIDGLEKGTIENPILEEQTWISSAAMIHREEIQEYIKGTELELKKLLEWAKVSLKEKERVKVRRNETKVETQDVHQKMEFNPVPPGRFQMGDGQHKVATNLTHSIEMMSTQVTQKMWVEEMGDNPSKFTDGENTIVVSINGKSIKMQPDNPVEHITWWSAVTFANKKSEKMKLKPAYDLSQIKWKAGTTAEAGTLQPENDQEGLKLKINAPNGDIYEAEGFRLSTEAEKEYMLRNMGQSNGDYPHGIAEADLKDHGWYSANADSKTHPVGTTPKSFMVDGKEYHDLVGNVWEWGHDWYASDLKGGDNPQGPTTGSLRVMRGGGWYDDAQYLRAGYRVSNGPGSRYSSVGLRLVRTAK